MKEKLLLNCIEFLWTIIDDIDTYGDMAKGNDKMFRKLVEDAQKRRWETGIESDGYSLDFSGLKTCPISHLSKPDTPPKEQPK